MSEYVTKSVVVAKDTACPANSTMDKEHVVDKVSIREIGEMRRVYEYDVYSCNTHPDYEFVLNNPNGKYALYTGDNILRAFWTAATTNATIETPKLSDYTVRKIQAQESPKTTTTTTTQTEPSSPRNLEYKCPSAAKGCY